MGYNLIFGEKGFLKKKKKKSSLLSRWRKKMPHNEYHSRKNSASLLCITVWISDVSLCWTMNIPVGAGDYSCSKSVTPLLDQQLLQRRFQLAAGLIVCSGCGKPQQSSRHFDARLDFQKFCSVWLFFFFISPPHTLGLNIERLVSNQQHLLRLCFPISVALISDRNSATWLN